MLKVNTSKLLIGDVPIGSFLLFRRTSRLTLSKPNCRILLPSTANLCVMKVLHGHSPFTDYGIPVQQNGMGNSSARGSRSPMPGIKCPSYSVTSVRTLRGSIWQVWKRTVIPMFKKYDDVITVRELCEMLKIGKNTAYDLIHSGQIKSVYVKRQIRIAKASVIQFLKHEI